MRNFNSYIKRISIKPIIVIVVVLISCAHRTDDTKLQKNGLANNDSIQTLPIFPIYADSLSISEEINILKEIEMLKFTPSDFRANIPIFIINGNRFYTTYNFELNYIPGNKTVYLSPSGNDNNDGLTSNTPKKTIESALSIANINTIILLSGIYKEGVNFRGGVRLNLLNLIGLGSVILDNNKNEPPVITGSVFIKNITFLNGNHGSLRTYLTNAHAKCTYINCKFNNSFVDNEDISKAKSLGGLRIQGGTHFLYRCFACNNGYDGFSYHSAPDDATGKSSSPDVVEVECQAYNNGINNSYESNNGSTAHDGARILRLNCTYGSCHGPLVADVHSSTISWNFGCTAFSAQGDPNKFEFQSNYFAASGATQYLIGCSSFGSHYDITSLSGSHIYSNREYPQIYLNDGSIENLTLYN